MNDAISPAPKVSDRKKLILDYFVSVLDQVYDRTPSPQLLGEMKQTIEACLSESPAPVATIVPEPVFALNVAPIKPTDDSFLRRTVVSLEKDLKAAQNLVYDAQVEAARLRGIVLAIYAAGRSIIDQEITK